MTALGLVLAKRERTRQHVDMESGEVSEVWHVPGLSEFEGEFLDDPILTAFATEIIEAYPIDFEWLEAWRLRVLWKASGGGKNGRSTLGKALLPNGLAKHFGHCDFVIWVARDHVEFQRLTEQQMRALVYHELTHLALAESGDELRPTLRGHDAECFAAEIREFGPWKQDLRSLERAFVQFRGAKC